MAALGLGGVGVGALAEEAEVGEGVEDGGDGGGACAFEAGGDGVGVALPRAVTLWRTATNWAACSLRPGAQGGGAGGGGGLGGWVAAWRPGLRVGVLEGGAQVADVAGGFLAGALGVEGD